MDEGRGRSSLLGIEDLPEPEPTKILDVSFPDPGTFENRTVKRYARVSDGKHHRLDGPASVERRPDGSVSRETYAVNGRVTRLDGPAVIDYARDGAVEAVAYYYGGAEVPDLAEVAREFERDRTLRRLINEQYASSGWSLETIHLEMLANSSLRPLLDEGYDVDTVTAVLGEGVHTLEGVRAVLEGAPPEWARSFEAGRS